MYDVMSMFRSTTHCAQLCMSTDCEIGTNVGPFTYSTKHQEERSALSLALERGNEGSLTIMLY